jgi:acyl dehydratase
VKSSKVGGTWCFAFERFRYKPSPVSPPGLLEEFFCNVKDDLSIKRWEHDIMENSKDIIATGIDRYRQKMLDTILYPPVQNEVATKDAIRHFADGLGDPNPLWQDEDYAKSSRYGAIVAPPCFLNAVSEGQAIVGLPGLIATFVGSEWEWFTVIRVNDRFSVTNHLVDLRDLPEEKGRRRLLQSGILNYQNQKGELVGRCRWNVLRTEAKPALRRPGGPEGDREKTALHPYSEKELAAIYSAIDQEEVRGGNPRYFEDVIPGEEIPPVVKGPLSLSDMVAWAIGTSWHRMALAHGPKLRYLRKNPGLSYVDPETGLPEPIGNSHFTPSAAKILMGSSLPLDLGFQRVCWLSHGVTNWMGDDGFLKKLETRLKGFVRFGDTTWCKGRIAGKRVEGEERLVDLDLFSENQNGEVTTVGKAVVCLPSKRASE